MTHSSAQILLTLVAPTPLYSAQYSDHSTQYTHCTLRNNLGFFFPASRAHPYQLSNYSNETLKAKFSPRPVVKYCEAPSSVNPSPDCRKHPRPRQNTPGSDKNWIMNTSKLCQVLSLFICIRCYFHPLLTMRFMRRLILWRGQWRPSWRGPGLPGLSFRDWAQKL